MLELSIRDENFRIRMQTYVVRNILGIYERQRHVTNKLNYLENLMNTFIYSYVECILYS